MRQNRIWVSVIALIVLLGAMYALNSASTRPKPPPDVEYEGRLAHMNETAMPEDEGIEAALEEEASDETSPEEETAAQEAPTVSDQEQTLIDQAEGSVVKLETEKGDIYLDLYDDKTPVTVGSFLELIGRGYYDGLEFHRVIPNFMIQGGCPRGDGTGGPGFTIPDEADKGLKHVRGSLSMAKTAAPNTGGSQFFVCHAPQPHLNGVHTVFGECIEGMDVVDNIAKGDKISKAVVLKKSPSADDIIKQAKDARVPE